MIAGCWQLLAHAVLLEAAYQREQPHHRGSEAKVLSYTHDDGRTIELRIPGSVRRPMSRLDWYVLAYVEVLELRRADKPITGARL